MNLIRNLAQKEVDIRDSILWFMVAIYPLIIIPNPITYSTFPRFLILCFISPLAIYAIIRKKVDIRHPVLIPLGLFLFFMIISTVFAHEPLVAVLGNFKRFTGLITYICCLILFLTALASSKKEKLLNPLIICAAIVSFIALLQYFGIHLEPQNPAISFNNRGHGTIGNPNFFGTYAAFTLMASILFYIRYQKLQWLVCTALIYAGLLVCLTRGVWLAAFISFILAGIYALRIPEKRKHFGIVLVTFIVITGLLLPIQDGRLYKRIFSIDNEIQSAVRLENKAGTGRLYIWKEIVKIIPDYWAFGIGPDNLGYADILIEKSDHELLADKAHNIYLEILITMGIFALLAYLAFFIHVFWSWYKEGTGFIYFIMIFTYLLQGFFNIDVVPMLPLFWIVLGLSLQNYGAYGARASYNKNYYTA